MKKYRIVNRTRFTAFAVLVIIVCAFAVSSLMGINNASGASTQEYVQIKVTSGDTLWNLAKEYGPKNTDTRMVVYEICQLNNITASELMAGQFITIPTEL